jgi:hypothetical protein
MAVGTPGKIGRFLVRDALNDAIEKLRADNDIEDAPRDVHLDHDVKDVPGSPDLVRTILAKIEKSEVVVADVTIVGKTEEGKGLINSNVAIELDYASMPVRMRGRSWCLTNITGNTKNFRSTCATKEAGSISI